MRSKIDGQNLLFIVMLALILMLSYCAIPHGEKETDPWEKAKMERLAELEDHHDLSSEPAAHHETKTAAVAHEAKSDTGEQAQEATHEAEKEHAVAASHDAPAEKTAAEADTHGEPAVADAEQHQEPLAEKDVEKEEAHPAKAEAPAEKEAATEAPAAPAVSGGSAGTVAAVMAMNNADYAEHKKPIVIFTHQKHMKDYGVGCGACHHDDAGAPLDGLTLNDAVEGCIACHDQPAKAPAKVDGKKLSKADKMAYHADALHENCITCHKEFNKKNNTKAAPASCGKCHDKDKTMPQAAPAAAPEPAAAQAAEASTPEQAPASEDETADKADAAAPAPEKAEAPAEKEGATEAPAAPAVSGGTAGTVAAVMAMNNAGYAEHKKPIVIFTHQKHMKDYGAGCGACHHDDAGQPLDNLTLNDAVEGCIACHDQPAKAPAKVDGKKLSKADKLAYHADALHENCITCHKEFNKKNNTKAAPASCGKCHDKTKTMPAPAPAAAPEPAAVEAKAAPAEAEAEAQAESETAAPAEKAAAPETKTEAEEAPETKTEAAAETDTAAAAPAAEEASAPEAAAAPAAGAAAADVITMENSAYAHKKGIVQFSHKKHMADYGINCGECHHDDQGTPLSDLKMGDAVEGCIACHDQPGKAPKEQDGKKLSKADKLTYHADALHENCITCHKEYNKKNNTKAAPASCGKCHPKN